jgi:hypothetical protein
MGKASHTRAAYRESSSHLLAVMKLDPVYTSRNFVVTLQMATQRGLRDLCEGLGMNQLLFVNESMHYCLDRNKVYNDVMKRELE